MYSSFSENINFTLKSIEGRTQYNKIQLWKEWKNSMEVQLPEMNHNNTKMVMEKGRFPRHLPVNENQEYRQEGTGKGMTQKARQEGDGKMPLLSAPAGGEIEAWPARDVSDAGRLITKFRRWWKKAVFSGTCQSTKFRNTDRRALERG